MLGNGRRHVRSVNTTEDASQVPALRLPTVSSLMGYRSIPLRHPLGDRAHVPGQRGTGRSVGYSSDTAFRKALDDRALVRRQLRRISEVKNIVSSIQ